jgi:hypothetical protein
MNLIRVLSATTERRRDSQRVVGRSQYETFVLRQRTCGGRLFCQLLETFDQAVSNVWRLVSAITVSIGSQYLMELLPRALGVPSGGHVTWPVREPDWHGL